MNQNALGAVTAIPGVIEIGAGSSITLFDSASGKRLFSYQDSQPGSFFWGPGSISNGVLYQGNMDGRLYAFGT